MFEPWLTRWQLRADGNPIITRGSRLLPVRMDAQAAMLKLTTDPEEKSAAQLLAWWDGDGAVRVHAHEDNALLMERAEGPGSLLQIALHGRDDEASRIACAVAARLHAPRPAPRPVLLPLEEWFQALFAIAGRECGILRQCATVAQALLAEPRDVGVLHGDIHHGNVLDAGSRGWLAIDPKWVFGERGFVHANLLCNPSWPPRPSWRGLPASSM